MPRARTSLTKTVLSPVAEPTTLPPSVGDFSALVDLLDAHGARGFGSGDRSSFSEEDRWRASQILLSTLAAEIAGLRPGRDKFVPVLRKHLMSLGLPTDERSCHVLKGVAEQLIVSNPKLTSLLGMKFKRKSGVSDVRASGMYAQLSRDQYGRCATCGLPLSIATSVELDHIVPYSLIGDIADGANWRLLCGECNMGKHDFLSSWLAFDAWNWTAPSTVIDLARRPTLRARYSVLATRVTCEYEGCTAGPAESHLQLLPRFETGLHVPSNLVVCCETHTPLNI